MSGPSFSNIDLWLFELEEGNLSSSQVQQLEMFLLQHPEFDVDKDTWSMAKMNSEEMVFPNTDRLIKKREIGWFYLASAASIVLLFLSIDYSGLSSNSTLVAKNSQHDIVKTLLKNEVEAIRAKEMNRTKSSVQNSTINQNVISFPLESENSKINEVKATEVNKERKNLLATTRGSSHRNISFSENEFVSMDENNLSNKSNELRDVLTINREELGINHSTTGIRINSNSSNKYFSHFSMKKKLKSIGRKIERMANNPIALRNYRDPDFHVAGLLVNDVNFSSTGTMLANRFQTLSRIQWLGKENEQMMNQISFDGYSSIMKGGIGVQLNHSMYANGGINVSNIAVTYSPKLSLSKTVTFEPSVRFKMGNKRLNYNRMNGVDKIEVSRQNMQNFYPDGQTPIGKSLWYKDLGLGLMVNTEWFYISGQVDNLFRHSDNMYENNIEQPRKAGLYYSFSAGTDWVSQNKKMSFSPYIVFQKNENLSEAWLGANYRMNWFTMGAGVSSSLDPTASIGLKFRHFSLQYTADYLTSDMTHTRAISHQITLRIIGKPNRFGKRILNQ